MTQEQILVEIQSLKDRNNRVEREKARETSRTRKLLIIVSTYLVMCLVFINLWSMRRYLDAIVPTVWFTLSTQSFDRVKKWWMR